MAKEEKTSHSILAIKWEEVPELRRKANRRELVSWLFDHSICFEVSFSNDPEFIDPFPEI